LSLREAPIINMTASSATETAFPVSPAGAEPTQMPASLAASISMPSYPALAVSTKKSFG